MHLSNTALVAGLQVCVYKIMPAIPVSEERFAMDLKVFESLFNAQGGGT